MARTGAAEKFVAPTLELNEETKRFSLPGDVQIRGDFTDWFTLKDCVRFAGIRYQALIYHLRAGSVRLTGVKHGVQWFVHRDDLIKFAFGYNEKRLRKEGKIGAADRARSARVDATIQLGDQPRELPPLPKIVEGERVYTAQEVADALGLNLSTVKFYLAPSSGKFRTIHVAGRREVLVPESEVERYRRERLGRRGGRPKVRALG